MVTQKERYWSDAEYRQRMLDYVKKYNQSEKGKLSLKRNKEKFRVNHPEYNKIFYKRKRDIARQNKMCIRCFKNKPELDYKTCNDCRDYGLKYRKISKVN